MIRFPNGCAGAIVAFTGTKQEFMGGRALYRGIHDEIYDSGL